MCSTGGPTSGWSRSCSVTPVSRARRSTLMYRRSGYGECTSGRILALRRRRTLEPDEAAVITRLWDDYKTSGSREARDRLIIHYSALVKYVAGRVSVGLPQNIEQAD